MCAKVKVSHGTANIAKEKIIANLINLLAPRSSKSVFTNYFAGAYCHQNFRYCHQNLTMEC